MVEYVIKENDTLVINDNEEYIITGDGNLNIIIGENVSAKVLLKDSTSKINLNMKNYSFLDLVEVNYKDTNNKILASILDNASLKYTSLSSKNLSEDLVINLDGYKAIANVECLVLNKDNKSDFNQQIYHNAKETNSHVNNIGLALDNAAIDFETVSKINKGMSKSNASQLARGIIIGEHAYITSQPILKIDEYDVKANHGTAIGRMSDNELFYLMSRGLTKEEAYKLILFGLITPVIKSIWNEEEANNYFNFLNNLL